MREARPNRPANDKSTPTNYAYDNGHILFHISDNEIRRCLVGHIHYVSPLLPTTDIDFFCDLRCASEYSNRCWAVAQQMAHLAESQDGLEMTKNGLDCASHLFCFVLTVGHVNTNIQSIQLRIKPIQAPKASACSYRSMLNFFSTVFHATKCVSHPCSHSSSDRQPHSSCPGKHALVSAVRSELESPHPSLASPDSFRQVQRHTLSRSHFLAVSPQIPTSQSPRSPRLAATDSASAVAPDLRGGSSLNSSSHAYRVRQEARSKCIHHRNTLEPALERRRLLRQKPTCVTALSPHALPQWSLLIQLLQNRHGFVI